MSLLANEIHGNWEKKNPNVAQSSGNGSPSLKIQFKDGKKRLNKKQTWNLKCHKDNSAV